MFNPNRPKEQRENETNPGRRPKGDQDKRDINQRDKDKDKDSRRVEREG